MGNKETDCQEDARRRFGEAETFEKATEIVWGNGRDWHGFYQHYTTLSSAVTKISSGRWWLSRSDSDTLNDRQESLKFGKRSDYSRTYQASFVHGSAESAALWGLYVPEDPFAIRITVSGKAMQEWVESLKNETIHTEKSECKIESVDFRDIIYAAVGFRDKKKTRLDVTRNNGLYWAGVNSPSKLPNIEDAIHDGKCSTWMKDYEWRHECESRLCVRVEKVHGAKAMWVPVCENLTLSMKFTFSPWLDVSCESEVERILKDTLVARYGEDNVKKTLNGKPFRRSVLQGALNLRYGRCKGK